jgi:hypothetical protein
VVATVVDAVAVPVAVAVVVPVPVTDAVVVPIPVAVAVVVPVIVVVIAVVVAVIAVVAVVVLCWLSRTNRATSRTVHEWVVHGCLQSLTTALALYNVWPAFLHGLLRLVESPLYHVLSSIMAFVMLVVAATMMLVVIVVLVAVAADTTTA